MRVISGSARGTKLAALPGEDITRPTVDRVKEGMFSALQFILPGAKVLDLFAGSGQLGIEALSRGAASCVFVDQDRGAVRIVEQNCKAVCRPRAGFATPERIHFWPAAGSSSTLCCWIRPTAMTRLPRSCLRWRG